MKDRTDCQLVEAARRGDVDSFAALYERNYASMVSVAYSLLGDCHLAEDAAQEAFAIACRDMGRLRRADRFVSWLRGICRNVAKGIRRSRMTVSAVEGAPSRPDEPSDSRSDGAVREAVMALPPRYREVVLLHYFNGISHKHVAGVLGISPEAVHGRLVRARRKIAAHLKYNSRSREQS